ncbi:hypothetical protein [Wuhan cricket virus]|uniref:hypothetical protein n=1 Tax=Wuhan cricket virus TaxID=1746070 RepID=UPI000705BCB4|nr:hypothetical protein [Wuhan cricket virus]ALL52917.1 hypothetical protein [Wuhan cricket virus]
MNITKVLLVALVGIHFGGTAYAATNTGASVAKLTDIWSIGSVSKSWNPSDWSDDFKLRVYQSLTLVIAIAFLGGTMAHMIVGFVVGIGLVHNTWVLTGALILLYYGYKRGHPIAMILGAVCSYVLAFGQSLAKLGI